MRQLTALVLAVSLSLAPVSATIACGNSYTQYYVLSGATRSLDAAERSLLMGFPSATVAAADRVAGLAATGTALRSFPSSFREAQNIAASDWYAEVNDMAVDSWTSDGPENHPRELPAAPAGSNTSLAARARMLRGIAIARMNGQLNSRLTPIRRATAEQRAARFQFALDDLAAALAANPTDARVQAYQAEARARLDPSNNAQALTTLRSLAQRDVLFDPWSWAKLARLEDNDAARAAALARCTAMAGANARRACVP